ncbi:hypothetical protein PDO_3630 [Rhizobium sp. PDO1-076]|nr:hypothetical protein PDO_3630 [Rhizobium sp. PDO1-076]
MASFSDARETPAEQLWEEIEDVHAGMLGLVGSEMHMQPMAPFVDRKHTRSGSLPRPIPNLSRRCVRAVAAISAWSVRSTTITHACPAA